jgi:hypothetical protein
MAYINYYEKPFSSPPYLQSSKGRVTTSGTYVPPKSQIAPSTTTVAAVAPPPAAKPLPPPKAPPVEKTNLSPGDVQKGDQIKPKGNLRVRGL